MNHSALSSIIIEWCKILSLSVFADKIYIDNIIMLHDATFNNRTEKLVKYRIGWPLWKLSYKLGFTLTYRVYITVDHSDGVTAYTAESPDFGLVCEMPTLEELIKEIEICANDILEEELKTSKSVNSRGYLANGINALI